MNWFQTDECYDFYKSLPFLEAFKFEVKRDGEVKGKIVGYIQKDGGKLKQFFSRRAIINGGPYLAEDITDAEVVELLERCKSGLKGKCIYFETRNFEDYDKYKETFQNVGFVYEPHYNFMIRFDSESDYFSNFSQNHKRSIKSALRDGVIINDIPSKEEIHKFYSVLSDLYEKKVKTPLFPESFFQELAVIGKLITVSDNCNKIIGGIAMATSAGDTCYEWFVCGNDTNYKKLHPSTIATYAGIKYAYENGYKAFDMMGAGAPGDGGYGVRDFKAKFGGELVEYGRFKCILNRPLYYIGVLGVKILKKI